MKALFGGGLNESQAPDISEAAESSYNFELSKDSYALKPRAPFDLAGTATNLSEVRGLMQLVKRDDTETTLVQAADTVYKWDGASTFSSVGSCDVSSKLRDVYWSLGDYSVITDILKATVVKKWDGTTFSTLSTGLGANLFAKYGIVHQGRMWLFNVTTTTDTPHLLVASAFENPQSYDTTQRATTGTFSSTGLEAFYMLSPDLRPINGVAKTVAGDLVISTQEGSLFKLTGTNATNYAFSNFYPGSQAVGTESMTSTGNDIVYMRKGGNIESLEATQKYGDVQADDLSRWIQNTVADLTSSITVYDQKNQKVLFFVSGKVLVLFKDILFAGALTSDTGERKRVSPWSVYQTTHPSGFDTSVAKFMRRPGTMEQSVYFGGSSGEIFDLNGDGVSGDGATTAGEYLFLPGVTGNYASTPDAAPLDIVGDIDIRVYASADDWTPGGNGQRLLAKRHDASNISYDFSLNASGTLSLSTSPDGSTGVTATSSVATGVSDGEAKWLRVTLDVDNGAAGRDAKFYLSDDGSSWTQLGTTQTLVGTTSIFASTSDLWVGDLEQVSRPFAGKIYRAQVYNGIGGTLVADFNPADGDAGDTSITSSTTGEVWTINQSGSTQAEIFAAAVASIQVIRKTRFIDSKDGINFLSHVTRGNVQYRRINEVGLNIELDWGDEYNTSAAAMVLKGPPASDTMPVYSGPFYYGGSWYYSQGFSFANKISHQNFSFVGRGPGCTMTISTLETVSYQVDSISLL